MTEVTLPPRFDETQTQANPWAKTNEELVAENAEMKQAFRALDLKAPADLEAYAVKAAWEIESKSKAKFDNKKKATKDFASWELVELELLNITTREAAKKRYMVEQTTADLSLFDDCITLDEALLLPEEPVQWRIKDLLMVGHITTVAAPAKAGKTVLQVNRVKSYVDGNALFGAYHVATPVTEGNVGVWNYELMPNQMHDWFRRAGIVNRHKIKVINARGAGLFIQNPLVLEKAIKWANDNDIRILEIDPLQAAFVGSVISDQDAGDYINALQRLQKETCIEDIILTTHMGHASKTDPNAERTIGSARWEGFADNMWIYKRDGDTSYLRIDKGRMEPVAEFALTRNAENNMLTSQGDQSGREAKARNDFFRTIVGKLQDGEVKFRTADVVEKVGGSDTKKKAEVRKVLDEMFSWGILECGKEVPEGSKTNQKADTVQMNEVGCRLFQNMIETQGHIVRPSTEQLASFLKGG